MPRPTVQTDDGMIALVLVMTITTVLLVSTLILFTTDSFGTSNTTFHVQDTQALYAAESGLDLAYASIGQATTQASLPCGPAAITSSFPDTPTASSTSVQVTYYDTFPVTDAALTCSQVTTGAVIPVAAEITGTGTAHRVTRYMQALVKLSTSLIGSVFDKALFSNATMTGQNNPTIYGHIGDDGNIYSNGSVNCGNNFVDQGSVTAEGGFTGTNNCVVDGNVTVVGNINMQNNATIAGSATSTGSAGCASQGSITMANNATVDQSAYAYCTISLSNNATVVQTQVQHDTTLTNPTVETFPVVPEPTGLNDGGAQAAWIAGGYSVVTDNTCTGAGSVYNAIGGYTSPTVVMTTCALSWANNSSITLQTNVAVFSTGGFSMQNNTSWQSNNSTTRLLYLVVPSQVNGVTTTCSSGNPGISLQNNTSFASNLNVLFYTPCTMNVSNNSTGWGQVYAGVVAAANNFSEHFVPLPSIYEATGGGQVNGPLSVAVAYERQVLSAS